MLAGTSVRRPNHDARGRHWLLRCFVVRSLPRSVPLIALSALAGCVEIVPSPFQPDAAVATDAEDAGETAPDSETDGGEGGPSGKICSYDEDCNDQVPCTFDRCDPSTRRCVVTPDDLACQDDRYCNGVEKCDPKFGCSPGEPVTCSDADPCTIDRCVEEQMGCEHLPRDVDGDLDPDYHCAGGTDCNDLDPFVNGNATEVCANASDDDCDGTVDEPECSVSHADTCSDPVLLESGKTVDVSTAGGALDYAASCVPSGASALRDAVGAIAVPQGAPMDLDVVARIAWGQLYLATAQQCADASSEIGCATSGSAPDQGMISRLIARNLSAGSYPVYVFSDSSNPIHLTATLRESKPKPDNETCGTALPIVPGVPTSAEILDAARDLATTCPAGPGDLVYSFVLDEAQDVRVYAASQDGTGNPVISLRDAGCAEAANELACRSGATPVVFERALPAGVYYVSVSATAPSVISVTVALSPATQAPPDETCVGSPSLTSGDTVSVSLDDHTDDIHSTCMNNAQDAAYDLSLGAASDVLLVGRISQGDVGAVSLMDQSCGADDLIACASSSPSPVRVAKHSMAPGNYRAIIETQKAGPAQLTAFVRPAEPPVFVLLSDTCDDAHVIPATGGFFQGNTSNSTSQYAAGCDQAGGAALGGPDQMLKLVLDQPRRVVFDMRGSGYRTLLNVRKGPSCPGQEMTGACTVGYYEQRSFLDLQLEPGEYFVQVDGYYGESGPWFLDVYTAPP